MSWAEIKKAVNSNLDVPLDEYMRTGIYHTFDSTLPNTGWNTVLDITDSSGVLDILCVIHIDNNTTRNTKITVDGELIEDVTLSGGISYEMLNHEYLSATWFSGNILMLGSSFPLGSRDSGDHLYSMYWAITDFNSVSHTLSLINGTYSGTYMIPIHNGLMFSNSIKIEASGTGKVRIAYRLF